MSCALPWTGCCQAWNSSRIGSEIGRRTAGTSSRAIPPRRRIVVVDPIAHIGTAGISDDTSPVSGSFTSAGFAEPRNTLVMVSIADGKAVSRRGRFPRRTRSPTSGRCGRSLPPAVPSSRCLSGWRRVSPARSIPHVRTRPQPFLVRVGLPMNASSAPALRIPAHRPRGRTNTTERSLRQARISPVPSWPSPSHARPRRRPRPPVSARRPAWRWADA